mmetsp:Transcript_7174/g.11900  ORF Transcript_7174/g.11900 Transcript_7174/m.11900 type:complete len:81 (-) Transcript_7174:534-776(-)
MGATEAASQREEYWCSNRIIVQNAASNVRCNDLAGVLGWLIWLSLQQHAKNINQSSREGADSDVPEYVSLLATRACSTLV